MEDFTNDRVSRRGRRPKEMVVCVELPGVVSGGEGDCVGGDELSPFTHTHTHTHTELCSRCGIGCV